MRATWEFGALCKTAREFLDEDEREPFHVARAEVARVLQYDRAAAERFLVERARSEEVRAAIYRHASSLLGMFPDPRNARGESDAAGRAAFEERLPYSYWRREDLRRAIERQRSRWPTTTVEPGPADEVTSRGAEGLAPDCPGLSRAKASRESLRWLLENVPRDEPARKRDEYRIEA